MTAPNCSPNGGPEKAAVFRSRPQNKIPFPGESVWIPRDPADPMKTILLTAALGLFSLITASAGAINETCPVSGKPVKAGKGADVEFSFCCENCKGKFDKAPGDYLKVAATAEDGKCPLSGKTAD